MQGGKANIHRDVAILVDALRRRAPGVVEPRIVSSEERGVEQALSLSLRVTSLDAFPRRFGGFSAL
jgi:hypothetical protein